MKVEFFMVGHISLHVPEGLSVTLQRQLFQGQVGQAFVNSSMGHNFDWSQNCDQRKF